MPDPLTYPMGTAQSMEELHAAIRLAQGRFADLIRGLGGKPVDLERYSRYLTMQYHLTKGVQRYFFGIAAHPSLARRRRLRSFLVRFANEEELHYLVAGNDLAKLGQDVGPCPLDVSLWHAFFERHLAEQPFMRLGAAVILENLSAGEARAHVKTALAASFLSRENTKFLTIHQHEVLPHGDQLLEAIERAALTVDEWSELLHGARIGTVMYLRMAEWALNPHCLAALADTTTAHLTASERSRIEAFSIDELKDAEPGAD